MKKLYLAFGFQLLAVGFFRLIVLQLAFSGWLSAFLPNINIFFLNKLIAES
jgi:hypothetical protein